METRKIDLLARFLAQGTDRRRALRAVAASALGSAELAKAARAAAATTPGEEWVKLYELMTASIDKLDAGCGTVVNTLKTRQKQNAGRLEEMKDDIVTWSADQRSAHQKAYNNRVKEASIKLRLSLTRCGYKPDSTSPYTEADINSVSGAPNPPATPMAVTSGARPLAHAYQAARDVNDLRVDPYQFCNPACDPGTYFTVGNCILRSMDCAGSGDARDCCWADICVSGFDHDQCVQTCMGCLNLQ